MWMQNFIIITWLHSHTASQISNTDQIKFEVIKKIQIHPNNNIQHKQDLCLENNQIKLLKSCDKKYLSKKTKRHTILEDDEQTDNQNKNTIDDAEMRQKIFELADYKPNDMKYADHFHFILNNVLPNVSRLSVREIMEADTETLKEIQRLYFLILILAERARLMKNQTINIEDILTVKKIHSYMTPSRISAFQVWFDSINAQSQRLFNVNLYLTKCYTELLNIQSVLKNSQDEVFENIE